MKDKIEKLEAELAEMETLKQRNSRDIKTLRKEVQELEDKAKASEDKARCAIADVSFELTWYVDGIFNRTAYSLKVRYGRPGHDDIYHSKGPFTRSDFKDMILGFKTWTQAFVLPISRFLFCRRLLSVKKSVG